MLKVFQKCTDYDAYRNLNEFSRLLNIGALRAISPMFLPIAQLRSFFAQAMGGIERVELKEHDEGELSKSDG